jgi:hypothetical protein
VHRERRSQLPAAATAVLADILSVSGDPAVTPEELFQPLLDSRSRSGVLSSDDSADSTGIRGLRALREGVAQMPNSPTVSMSLGKRSTGPSIRAARRAWYERSKRGLHSHALDERSSGLTTGFRTHDGIPGSRRDSGLTTGSVSGSSERPSSSSHAPPTNGRSSTLSARLPSERQCSQQRPGRRTAHHGPPSAE